MLKEFVVELLLNEESEASAAAKRRWRLVAARGRYLPIENPSKPMR
jgi:hypothetical protein